MLFWDIWPKPKAYVPPPDDAKNPRSKTERLEYNYHSIYLKMRSRYGMSTSRLKRDAANKRLPILFCLDVSASMAAHRAQGDYAPIELLNSAVRQMIEQLCDTPEAEVAFLTFCSDVIDYVGFTSIQTIDEVKFRVVLDEKLNGTKLAAAVQTSVTAIEDRRQRLITAGIEYFAPFLIIVTDGIEGDLKEADKSNVKKAQNLLVEHCHSHRGGQSLIIPFIIGVGNDNSLTQLADYARGFRKGYIQFNDLTQMKAFRNIFRGIGDSINKSINLNVGEGRQLSFIEDMIEEPMAEEHYEFLDSAWRHTGV